MNYLDPIADPIADPISDTLTDFDLLLIRTIKNHQGLSVININDAIFEPKKGH